MSQTIISWLKKREKLIIITQNKIEIMFEIYFSYLLIIFMKNVTEFNYSSSIDDETSMTCRKKMKIIHKINSNKIFKINEIINKMLQQLVRVVIKQISFFLINALRRLFNHLILRKSLQ